VDLYLQGPQYTTGPLVLYTSLCTAYKNQHGWASVYPLDIIVATTMGRPRVRPGMPPTLLEARELAIIVGMNTLTRIGTVFGMIFVILEGYARILVSLVQPKERHMSEQRTYSSTPTHAYIPDKEMLQDTRTPMTTDRASRFVSFVLGLVLGTGVTVLLAQLSTWLSA
jgi:hypothetical protein